MNKTFLIFRHEFLQTIKRKGFIIMTLIVPLGALLAIGVYQLISGITEPPVEEVTTIGYVDEAGGFDQYTTHGNIELIRFNTPEEATTALINGNVSEYFVISGDYISTGLINRYTLEKQLETPSATATVASPSPAPFPLYPASIASATAPTKTRKDFKESSLPGIG